ncbi:MAG: hypothetical protein IJW34_09650 [Clostridia bacterium]|nr:hypothetical protein [Clostridia bacterium]
MKNFSWKKALLVATAYLTVIALAIGGTLAYLQDEDSDVNVMTLGNVDIDQIEQQRDENGNLVDFVDGKPALPAVGPIEWADEGVDVNGTEYKVFTDELKNVIDKIITVKNTGKTAAYVRTIVAIEAPGFDRNNLIHINYNGDEGVTISAPIEMEYDGAEYVVFVFTYEEALAPGATSAPSLMQVFLDSKTTNDDCAKFGDTWEIYAVSQAVQAEGFADAATALNEAFGEITSNSIETSVDKWNGTADTSWYNENDTEFILTTAEQLAGLAELVDGGKNFEGKTIVLDVNVDLYCLDENGERIPFNPIGSYRNDTAFKGTFDAKGHTIDNMSQNTWALNTGYYYGDLGLGLFGMVENATVKNLVMDDASISGESAICGTVAATAYGDCTFENITVSNSKVNDYQYYAGGVVGWASGNHTYKNINMEASTTIGSQWGDFGNANGGIIGGAGTSGNYHFEDCTIACRIDAVNDVVSAYQWYNYRNSGMLIGKVGPETIVNEVTTVTADNVTCKNVTVIYGDWANYTYCEFAGTGYPYVRVQAGTSVDAYSNVRYGHPTDANGNIVVDDNHVHNDGEAHHELIAFDQLFGGPANHRYCYYGISEFDGVTVVYNNK